MEAVHQFTMDGGVSMLHGVFKVNKEWENGRERDGAMGRVKGCHIFHLC